MKKQASSKSANQSRNPARNASLGKEGSKNQKSAASNSFKKQK